MRDTKNTAATYSQSQKRQNKLVYKQLSAPVSSLSSAGYTARILEPLVTNKDETAQLHHSTCPEAVREPSRPPSLFSQIGATVWWFYLLVWVYSPFKPPLCLMADLALPVWRFIYLFIIIFVWCPSLTLASWSLSALCDAREKPVNVKFLVCISQWTFWWRNAKQVMFYQLPWGSYRSIVNPHYSSDATSSALLHRS